MKARPIIGWPLLFLFALALAAIAALWIAPRAPSVHLSDGSILRLEYVKYQATESGKERQAWFNTIRDWLNRKLGRPTFSPQRAPANSLVYWISRREKSTGRYMQMDWLGRVAAVDSHGCEFETAQPMLVQSPNWGAGSQPLPKAPPGAKYIVASGVLPAFPRRERAFGLRIYDRQLGLVAELTLPNPVYRAYPTWKPEIMPVTRQSGDSTASLVFLENRWEVRRPGDTETKCFSLTPEFQHSQEWDLSDLEVDDATGNVCATGPFGPRFWLHRRLTLMHRRLPLAVQFRLCTNESAWKLRATFFRTAQAQFASNEVWAVPHLEIPSPGVAKVLTGSKTWQGVPVKLCAIAGPGDITYSNGVPVSVAVTSSGSRSGSSSGRMVGGMSVSQISVQTDKPQIMIQISGLNDVCRFQGLARTAGRTYLCSESSSANDYKLLQLDVPDGTTSVDMIFVVQQPRVLDFLVRPQLPSGQ